MTPEERERMYELCKLITDEKDFDKYVDFVRELNDLLEEKQERVSSASSVGDKPKADRLTGLR